MGRSIHACCAVFLLLLVPGLAFAAFGPRISQVYGGGGATGAPTYSQDYVELTNAYATYDIDIGGFALESAAPGGNWGATPADVFVFPAGTVLHACSYLLVAMTPGSAVGTMPLPTPDYVGTASLDAVSGRVDLFSQVNANVPCGSEAGLIDKLSYGGASCPEVTAIGALSIVSGAVRKNEGNMDTDNNAHDFVIVTAPAPRNSASPLSAYCLSTPTSAGTWGRLKTFYR